jgi:hypothetical protein
MQLKLSFITVFIVMLVLSRLFRISNLRYHRKILTSRIAVFSLSTIDLDL